MYFRSLKTAQKGLKSLIFAVLAECADLQKEKVNQTAQ